MPIHIAPQSRREFLFTAGVAAFAWSQRTAAAADAPEDDIVYLLNDTHIGEKHPANSPVPSHLRQVVAELVERPRSPAAVVINGDLALTDGQPGDYRHLAQLLRPLWGAGLPLHLTLGNHDNRAAFYEVLQEQKSKAPVVESRHIAVVETQHANWFLLDSLQKTMVTQGTLGPRQLAWLAQALDARSDKPAIIVAHHNPRLGGAPNHFPGGLIDSEELWRVLASRNQVKAYVHGHIHDRTYAAHQGIHIINTPATSYVADPALSTTGWTIARLTHQGVTLTTRTTDAQHPWNNEIQSLVWR